MASSEKRLKTEAKLEKKRAKAEVKLKRGRSEASDGPATSPAVRYAEAVRGVIYVITGVSLLIALLLGQRGAIVSFDDLVESLFVARTGKLILALIGAALLIYGMKHLRIVR